MGTCSSAPCVRGLSEADNLAPGNGASCPFTTSQHAVSSAPDLTSKDVRCDFERVEPEGKAASLGTSRGQLSQEHSFGVSSRLLHAGADALPLSVTICSSGNHQVLYQNCGSVAYAGDWRGLQGQDSTASPSRSYLMQLLSLQPPETVEEVMEAIRRDDGPWVRVIQVPSSLAHHREAPQLLGAFTAPAVPSAAKAFMDDTHRTFGTGDFAVSTGRSAAALADPWNTTTLDSSHAPQTLGSSSQAQHRTLDLTYTGSNLTLVPYSTGSHLKPSLDLLPGVSVLNFSSSPSTTGTLQQVSLLESVPAARRRAPRRQESSSWLEQQLPDATLPPQPTQRRRARTKSALDMRVRRRSVIERAIDEIHASSTKETDEDPDNRNNPRRKPLVSPLSCDASEMESEVLATAASHSSSITSTRARLQHLLRSKTTTLDDHGAPPTPRSLVGETATAEPSTDRGEQQAEVPRQQEGSNLMPGLATQQLPVQHEAKVWHEITITPFTNPDTGDKAFVVAQSDVTQRCKLEQRLMQMTEAQLHMLESMFPRHILERITEIACADQTPCAAVPADGRDSKATLDPAAQPLTMTSLRRELNQATTFHDCVTIMFTDICGFTTMSETVAPQQVMTFLNELFYEFDRLVKKHKVSKVETAGDCFIICAGLCEEDEDGFLALADNQAVPHARAARRALNFAAEMMHVAQRFTMPDGKPVRQRVGIHSGPVVSGLIGNLLPKFSLFGDTMNTASRMESTSIPGRIQVSEATHALLKDAAECWECTGGVEVKGKGVMNTFLLKETAMNKPFITPNAAVAVSSRPSSFAQLLDTSMYNIYSSQVPSPTLSVSKPHFSPAGSRTSRQLSANLRRGSSGACSVAAVLPAELLVAGASSSRRPAPNMLRRGSSGACSVVAVQPAESPVVPNPRRSNPPPTMPGWMAARVSNAARVSRLSMTSATGAPLDDGVGRRQPTQPPSSLDTLNPLFESLTGTQDHFGLLISALMNSGGAIMGSDRCSGGGAMGIERCSDACHTSGPHISGPHISGPHSNGPHTSGPHSNTGPHISGPSNGPHTQH